MRTIYFLIFFLAILFSEVVTHVTTWEEEIFLESELPSDESMCSRFYVATCGRSMLLAVCMKAKPGMLSGLTIGLPTADAAVKGISVEAPPETPPGV